MVGKALAACCGICFVVGLIPLLFGWTTMAPTEMALNYNYVFKTVSPEIVKTAGLHFVGPFNKLLKYPTTSQTILYDASHKDLLDGRTRDGLPLIIGLSFQYKLLTDDKSLLTLYHTFDENVGDYQKLYQRVGMHIVTEMATNFTAAQFFNEKQNIAVQMQRQLDEYFQKNLFATVDSLQIDEDDLPPAFTSSVLAAAAKKQEITKMEKTRDAAKVNFTTARQVAEAQANVTLAQANGERHRILQSGQADAAIIDAYVQAETAAYRQAAKAMSLSSEDLIKYIWYDTLGGGSVSAAQTESRDIQLMVGVDPAAYISEVRPA